MTIFIIGVYFCSVFREEERESREAGLMRELEEKHKQHRETVERLKMQVSEALSQYEHTLGGCVCSLCLTVHRSHSWRGKSLQLKESTSLGTRGSQVRSSSRTVQPSGVKTSS